MPCYSGYDYDSPNGHIRADHFKKELDRVTRVACELASLMPGYDDGAWDHVSSDTLKWCKEHKAWDKQRRKKKT